MSEARLTRVIDGLTAGKSTRRDFLRRSAALGLALQGVGLSAALPRGVLAQTAGRDYATRAAFDELDLSWNGGLGRSEENNDFGALGWGESYFLQAYGLMYEAYRDTYYLDKIIDHFDRVLTKRDSERGISDYRGLSLPSWSCAGSYTCGALVLQDAGGRPTIEVRTGARPSYLTSVTVSAGTEPGTFKLSFSNSSGAYRTKGPDVYDNLSSDPSSPGYAVTRINNDFERLNIDSGGPSILITAKEPAQRPITAGDPIHGTFNLIAIPYIYAVQVGQITYGISRFVRFVYETPQLRRDPHYKAKADEYLVAIEAAVAVHDVEFRENELGEGWYYWPKGSPIIFDGSDQPHNQFLSLARTLNQLHAITGNPAYLDKAVKMARTFKNDLRINGAGAYIWNYFWTKGLGYSGWAREDGVSEYQPTFAWPYAGGYPVIEDTNHGFIDMTFGVQTFRDHLGVFNGADMERFAKTFTENLAGFNAVGTPRVRSNVDGTGGLGYTPLAASWVTVAFWDESIFTHEHELFNAEQNRGFPGSPGTMIGTAYLNWWAQGASPKPGGPLPPQET